MIIWYVYLLHLDGIDLPSKGQAGSRDTYVGITPYPEARLHAHNAGQVTATRGRKWQMVARMRCSDRATAALVERWLKTGDSRDKRQRMALGVSAIGVVWESITAELIAGAARWKQQREQKELNRLHQQRIGGTQ